MCFCSVCEIIVSGTAFDLNKKCGKYSMGRTASAMGEIELMFQPSYL